MTGTDPPSWQNRGVTPELCRSARQTARVVKLKRFGAVPDLPISRGVPVAMARSSSKWSSVWDVACGSGSGEGRCGARLQWRRGTVTRFSTSRRRRRRTEFDNKTW